MSEKQRSYQFLLPQVRKEPIGNQGEIAQYIPYRLEESVNQESILRELKAQPHMAELVRYLDPNRRIYLLECSSMEVLELAAEYIGTYHRLENCYAHYYDYISDEDIEEDGSGGPFNGSNEPDWQQGQVEAREVDFSERMPYLSVWDVKQFYGSEQGVGFGDHMFLPDHRTQTRPWWTLCLPAPIAISNVEDRSSSFASISGLCDLPEVVRSMSGRALIILMCLWPEENEVLSEVFDIGKQFTMEDVSFELETEIIRLGIPKANSGYKKEVLCQLAEERKSPLARPADAGRILSMVDERRGDVDNVTLSKAVSNALFRRKSEGPLTLGDFQYLSAVFISRKRKKKEKKSMELEGQQAVRTQLEQIVAGMSFQAQRKRLGLPAGDIHYTFAFLGPPGTGKTTWARWLGEEMKKRKLLDNTDSICINAAELKAQYVGHTTGRVHSIFERYGIIILDEAYSLTEGERGDCFGAEALSQLCVELENHGSDRLVVFAGYGGASDPSDNRMLRFLQSNPGINSRIAFKIHFQDFQAQELAEVLRAMLDFEGYRLPEGADRQAEDFFRRRTGRRAFGNCREARNLADRIKLRMAARLSHAKRCTKETASQILPEDVEGAMEEILQEFQGLDKNEGRSIGFS